MSVSHGFDSILTYLNFWSYGLEYRGNSPAPLGTGAIVTYSFKVSGNVPSPYEISEYVSGTSAFTWSEKNAFRAAATAFERVADIRFVEVSGPAMVELYGVVGSDYAGWVDAFLGSTEDWTDSTDLIIDWSNVGWSGSEYAMDILLHKLGHAIGLSHPHDGDLHLPWSLDNRDVTVMSYEDVSQPDGELEWMDRAALEHLYGNHQNSGAWDVSVRGDVIRVTADWRSNDIVGGDLRNDIRGGGGNDRLYGRDKNDTLNGASGDDRLYGQHGHDRLLGKSGDDRLYGGSGSDRLSGSTGADRMYGGDDGDRLSGGSGNDRMYGDDGHDRLSGGAGHDRLYGGWGGDWLHGGSGSDKLYGDDGSDRLIGGASGDRLWGGGGQDRLSGGGGHDRLNGGSGNDRLSGGSGSDVLRGGSGKDILTGGSGSDTFKFNGKDANARDVIKDFELGVDKLSFGGGLVMGDADVVSRSFGTTLDFGELSIDLRGVDADAFQDHNGYFA